MRENIKNFIENILFEAASFNQLLRGTQSRHKPKDGKDIWARSRTVKTQPPSIRKDNGNIYIIWNFKAFPSTENRRHKGFIKCIMPLRRKDRFKPLSEWDVLVSCDCKDWLFRGEYSATRAGASKIIFSNGQPARITNPQNKLWLCKHLVAAGDYLAGVKLDPKSFLTDFPVSALPSKTGLTAVAATIQKQGASAQASRQPPPKKFLNQPREEPKPKEPKNKEQPKAVNKSMAQKDKERKEMDAAKKDAARKGKHFESVKMEMDGSRIEEKVDLLLEAEKPERGSKPKKSS